MRAFAGRERALLAGGRAEGHRAHRVAVLERHVRQQHHGVQHLVEMCGADRALPIVCAHAPAAVDEQQDALVALVLKLADDRLAQSQRGAPVHVAHRIADAVLGQLLEVRAFAALLVGLDADFLQAAIARKPRVPCHLGEVGVDTAHLVGAEPLEQLAQPPARADPHIRRRELSPRPSGSE